MKTIPIALLSHKAQHATTLTDLLKVGPLPDGSYRGFTLLDANLTYAGLTYYARTGFQMSALQSDNSIGVDNAEAQTLAPVAGFNIEGITQEQIDAGELDKVPFQVVRVNYRDLSMGHEIVHTGTIGEMRVKSGGLTVLELRSLSNQLKQSVGELDSINCRARFGSQVGEERFPCGYDLAGEWVDGMVTAVEESDRVFVSDLTQADDYFAPGVVRWVTGANAGQEMDVETFTVGDVTLQFPTGNPIVMGDTFQIRRDCSRMKDGHNGCQTFWGAEWVNHYRGEPHIPVGDSARLLSPGAGTSAAGMAGTGEA